MAKIVYQCEKCEKIHKTVEEANMCCDDVLICSICGRKYEMRDKKSADLCCIRKSIESSVGISNDYFDKYIYSKFDRGEISFNLYDWMIDLAYDNIGLEEGLDELLTIKLEHEYQGSCSVSFSTKQIYEIVEYLNNVLSVLNLTTSEVEKIIKEKDDINGKNNI